MGKRRSRSRSPRRERHRSRSRDREPRGERDRERAERDRDRERDRRRDRVHRSRSRSPRRRRRSRSYSPRKRSRSRSRENDIIIIKGNKHDRSSMLVSRPQITDADLEGKSPEEIEMMKTMGFGGFETTKGKQVPGNDIYVANIAKKRRYRQYMNRRGGFNRPLDFIA